MAYTKKHDGPAFYAGSQKSAGQFGTGQKQMGKMSIPSPEAEFYEIEPAMVMDICTEDHPNFDTIGGYGFIGAVKFKMLYSNITQNQESLGWALPLSSNLREYPVVGELVCIVQYLGIPFYHKRINYMNSINGSVGFDIGAGMSDVDSQGNTYAETENIGPREVTSENLKPGLNFYENYFIQPLKMSEGDMTYEGRLGQTLRLGHMARQEGEDPYELSNIKIRLGQLTDAEANDRGQEAEEAIEVANKPVDEHINDDGCSFWMTLGEQVAFSPGKPTEPAESLFKSLEEPPDTYDGKQIILNSDRIIFNTKAKEMMCFSKGDTYFNSTSNFIIDTDEDFIVNNLGNCKIESDGYIYIRSQGQLRMDGVSEINLGNRTGELIAKGETLVDVLNDLIDAIKNSLSPAGSMAGPYPVSLVNPGFLDGVSAKLNSILSDRVTTV